MLCGSKDCFGCFMWASKGDVKEFFGLRFGRFSACPDGVWIFLLDGVCIGWACALWLQSCCMWFQMVFA